MNKSNQEIVYSATYNAIKDATDTWPSQKQVMGTISDAVRGVVDYNWPSHISITDAVYRAVYDYLEKYGLPK